MRTMKKVILILAAFLITGCASTALAISGGRIISHDFKIYQFSDDDYIDVFKLRRSYHDGVDRTIWIINIVEE
jgi:hypothetical protein